MLRHSIVPLAFLACAATARASGFAHFDTLSEGQYATTIVDGGITFSNMDNQLGGTANFCPEQADGTLTGTSGFTPTMTLGFTGWSPGPGAAFSRVKSFEMSTGSIESSCTLQLFDYGSDFGNTVTLEAYSGASVVASNTVAFASGFFVHHYTLSVSGASFDHLRVVGNGPQNTGCFFALIDEVQIGAGSPFAAFCSGDGSDPLVTTACPCGNNGALGHGCNNSAATGGSHLGASGTTAPDTLVLSATGELASSLSIFLQGNSTIAAGAVFGDGVRCVGGTLKRIAVESAIGGAVDYPGVGDPSISARSAALGDPISSGSSRYYQTYYRDPDASFCPVPTGGTFNVSNGVSVLW